MFDCFQPPSNLGNTVLPYGFRRLFISFAVPESRHVCLIQVSEIAHDTFRHLAWHLVYARQLDSDLNKARLAAVFENYVHFVSVSYTHLTLPTKRIV